MNKSPSERPRSVSIGPPSSPHSAHRTWPIIRLDQSSVSASLTFVSMKLYDLDPGPESPELVRMIVEIPMGSANKVEYDGELGLFRLDRALYSPMHYPGDYGFIPGTLAEDRDPLDVLTLVSQASFTGCLIEVRPVGVLNLSLIHI